MGNKEKEFLLTSSLFTETRGIMWKLLSLQDMLVSELEVYFILQASLYVI